MSGSVDKRVKYDSFFSYNSYSRQSAVRLQGPHRKHSTVHIRDLERLYLITVVWY